MLKAMPAVLAILFALSTPGGPNPTSATFVTAADVQATLQKAPPSAVSDQAIRMVDLGGLGYNRRARKGDRGLPRDCGFWNARDGRQADRGKAESGQRTPSYAAQWSQRLWHFR